MNEYVTLVNRTDRVLEGVWDGRVHEIKPGKQEVAREKAIKFVEQNPVMGSENPRTGSMIYKLGIEEMHMDCSPITSEFIAKFDPTEKWDRSQLTGARPSEVVAGDNGLYGMSEWRRGQPLSAAFTKID